MQFSIDREKLLKPLQLVTGIIERRQSLPILFNVLLTISDKSLSLTGTDSDVELIGKVELASVEQEGSTTVPARKLMDICKSLPENSVIYFTTMDSQLKIESGASRFILSTLPAIDFPSIEEEDGSLSFEIEQTSLRYLIDRTGFAMAQQDVRYYLNGMLLSVEKNRLRAVTTDGHRMAICTVNIDINVDQQQFIVPRKGILSLARIIFHGKGKIHLTLGNNHIRAKTSDYTFTSKLVDGKFPEYEHVIPREGNKEIIANRELLRQALNRASILSNEKYRCICFSLKENLLNIIARNKEQEKAEETIEVKYLSEELEIGFNVQYILNVLAVISSESVLMILSDSLSGVIIKEPDNEDSLYVIMPMQL